MSKLSLLLSGVAAAALLAGAAQAQTARSGVISGGISYSHVDFDDVDVSSGENGSDLVAASTASTPGDGWTESSTDFGDSDDGVTGVFINASGATPIGQGNTFLQGDLSASKAQDDGLETLGAQAFVGTRDSARRALAAFAVVEHAQFGDSDFDQTLYGGGVEGALYRGQNTFQGQLAYLTSDDDDLNSDLYGAAIQARRYVSENLSIEANVVAARVDGDGDDATFYGVGVAGEWQPSPGPVSFYAGVNYFTGDDIDADATVAMVGVRVRAGTTSLYDFDRRGASLRGAKPFTTALGAFAGGAGTSSDLGDDYDPCVYNDGSEFGCD